MKIPLATILLPVTVVALFALTLAPSYTFADGIVIRYPSKIVSPYLNEPKRWGDWTYADEYSQQALIGYENGIEKMLLSINLQASREDAVWIFPVPAPPTKVTVDLKSNFPQLRGEEITGKAKFALFSIKRFLAATQLYPIFLAGGWGNFWGLHYSGPLYYPDAPASLSSIAIPSITTDVVAYKHIEKSGLAAEVITAKTARGVYQYLREKGLHIEENTIPALSHYIGKDFTFVVSWIAASDTAPSTTRSRSVLVAFPTTKIYYPLLPTSAYGNKEIPATIRVIGYRTPETFNEIRRYTKVNYFIDQTASIGKHLAPTTPSEVPYTKIEIYAPSRAFTQDLWIDPRAPFRVHYSSFLFQHPILSGSILFFLSSVLASLIGGWIVFRELRNKKGARTLALVGLANCVSIIGTVIATTLLIKPKEQNPRAASITNALREKGYIWRRRLAASLYLITVPVLALEILSKLLSWELVENVTREARLIIHSPSNSHVELVLYIGLYILLYFVIPLAFILAFFFKKIRKGDEELFNQLKTARYSVWWISPRRRVAKKLAFLFLFSTIFLAIPWLTVKLAALPLNV